MSNASPESTSSRAARNSSASAGPLRPEDRRMAVSLVLWSPSIERRLSVLCTHHVRSSRSRSRGTATSVQRKQRSVAMFGSIMPAPFAIPTILPRPAAADRTFGKASVVMIARAIGRIEEPDRPATSPGRDPCMSRTGSSQPMIPVDAQKKSSSREPVSLPSVSRSPRASSTPRGVQTLEILLFASTPRIAGRSRRSRPMRTGAPGKRFRVNTAPKSCVSRSRKRRERFIRRGWAPSLSRGLNEISDTAHRNPSGRAARPARAYRYSDSEAYDSTRSLYRRGR